MKDEQVAMRLLSKGDLVEILRTSESTIDRKVKEDPSFPQPRKLSGNSIRWISGEVYAFIASLPLATDWADSRE